MSWAPGQALRRSKEAWKSTVPAPFEVIHPVDLNLVSEILGICRGPSRDAKEAGEGETEQLDFLPFPTAKQESLLLTASSVLGKLRLSWFMVLTCNLGAAWPRALCINAWKVQEGSWNSKSPMNINDYLSYE